MYQAYSTDRNGQDVLVGPVVSRQHPAVNSLVANRVNGYILDTDSKTKVVEVTWDETRDRPVIDQLVPIPASEDPFAIEHEGRPVVGTGKRRGQKAVRW